MKKVLFATTALVASAGMAAADVNLSGSGRFGIVYNEALNGVGQSETKIEKRMTINIDGSGTTDGGLEFGGRIRLRSDENDGAGTEIGNDANVFLGNDSFRITVGNTDGAMLNRVGYYQGTVGLTGLQWANVSFNIGNQTFYLNTYASQGQVSQGVVRLDFNVGGFGISLSTDSTGDNLSNGSEDAIAVSYNFGDWTVAAGYAKNSNNSAVAANERDAFSLSAVGSIGDFGVGVGYTDLENVGNKVTLSGSYNFGDTTITAFVARVSMDVAGTFGFAAGDDSEMEYGIGFTYSLGGAVLAGGISENYTGNTMADLGVRFSF
ncbi:MAG: porin [Pseudomonadota bacterium]